jgi:hypothetical protein
VWRGRDSDPRPNEYEKLGLVNVLHPVAACRNETMIVYRLSACQKTARVLLSGCECLPPCFHISSISIPEHHHSASSNRDPQRRTLSWTLLVCNWGAAHSVLPSRR